MRLIPWAIAGLLLTSEAEAATPIAEAIKNDYDRRLKSLFLDLHRHPELSRKEFRTAQVIARELRALGIPVTERVGGTGVVGVLRNGPGPTVLIRAEMDALPVAEENGLRYASNVMERQSDGSLVPVSHACGHDSHLAALIGTAARLITASKDWAGTVLLVAQPAEETGSGARAMLEDGLYTRFGKPDFALTYHVDADWQTGTLSADPGLIGSSYDHIEIVIHGVGAHGASPHLSKDPVVIGSEIVMAIQTLVSREISPMKPAVVTVGSFHAGTRENVISDRAVLQLSLRADDDETRGKLLQGISRIAMNTARASGVAEDRLPDIRLVDSEPLLVNDPLLIQRLRGVYLRNFGTAALVTKPRDNMGSDDFAYFSSGRWAVPAAYLIVGGTPPAAFAAAEKGGPRIPSHHSPDFKIDPEASIRLGIEAMTLSVLDLLKTGA